MATDGTVCASYVPIYILPFADDDDKSSVVILLLYRSASKIALNPLLVIPFERRSTQVKLVSIAITGANAIAPSFSILLPISFHKFHKRDGGPNIGRV
jgi:hypothetical protein